MDHSQEYILDLIYETRDFRFYRGYAESRQYSVLIKAIKKGASSEVVNQLNRDFEIAEKLDIDGICKPQSFMDMGEEQAIILEDNGGITLRGYLDTEYNRDMPADKITVFFTIALQLSYIIGELHNNSIFHQDIRPENILIDVESKKIWLTGFGFAVPFAEASRADPAEAVSWHGCWAYISPEQTGRIRQSLDYRTDLYSLGVLFYEILTGKQPFRAGEPSGWIHAHLIGIPPTPETINKNIPPVLGAIVMKLLQKNPSARYQSAFALQEDLTRCYEMWQEGGEIECFPLAEKDIAGIIIFSGKLYGRDKEIDILHNSLKSVGKGNIEVILISGYAGSGKTVLVNEAFKTLGSGQNGYFVYGKSDQLPQKMPYVSLMQAFRQLIHRIMAAERKSFISFRRDLLNVLGANGAVMAAILPEIERITGPMPWQEELRPAEAKNRLMLVIKNFVRVFARSRQPLVLFLDDLQWADAHLSLTLQRKSCSSFKVCKSRFR